MESQNLDSEEEARLDVPPSRAAAFVPALVLVVVGAWAAMTYQNQPDNPPAFWEIAAMLAAGAGVSMVAYFFIQGRQNIGLIFLGAFITLTTAAGIGMGVRALPTLWPLGLITLGMALLLARLLARHGAGGLVLPALACIAAGGVALAFTLGAVPDALAAFTVDYWPLLLAVVAACIMTAALYAVGDAGEVEAEAEAEVEAEAEEVD